MMTEVFVLLHKSGALLEVTYYQTECDQLRTHMCAEFGRFHEILSRESHV